MKREFRANADIELRQEEGEALPKIRGYAAVFNVLSEPLFGFRERILPGAFAKSLTKDIRALVNHDSSKIIGRNKANTLTLREDKKGLYVEITPPNNTLGRDVVESIRRGDLDQMSFGFQTPEGGDHWTKEEGKTIRELIGVSLFDVSVVAFPAYTQTSVAVRSLFPDGIPEDIEKNQVAEPGLELSPARKRLAEIEKEFGITH
jgi:uncharacterized protein